MKIIKDSTDKMLQLMPISVAVVGTMIRIDQSNSDGSKNSVVLLSHKQANELRKALFEILAFGSTGDGDE